LDSTKSLTLLVVRMETRSNRYEISRSVRMRSLTPV